jgi:hypothetical protein
MTKRPSHIYNESFWGTKKAEERYGKLKTPDTRPVDLTRPQDPLSRTSHQNLGMTPKSWITGGKGDRESAEGKPNFHRGGKK